MLLLYTLSVRLYVFAIRLMSPFSDKASEWLKGRRHLWQDLKDAIPRGRRIVWFHASSLGEFEQGRPVMEAWRKLHPDDFILLSFFSPSGYRVRKNYPGADHICYLPSDTPRHAARFVRLVHPDIVFFVKYDFWLHHIRAVTTGGSRLIFFSSRFRKEQYFFRWYGKAALRVLRGISWFFVQDEASAALLRNAGIQQCSVAGDTRFDRVAEAAAAGREIPAADRFAAGENLLVAGSSWPPDEELLSRLKEDPAFSYKMIIAPHEVHKAHIQSLMKKLGPDAFLFSEAESAETDRKRILVIDGMGILLHVYRLAHVAYIGGGFGKSIHNILEAAAFGKPVVFGPAFHKFAEAHDLIRLGGGFAVHNYSEFRDIIHTLFSDAERYRLAAEACAEYTRRNTGATALILQKASEYVR